MSLLDLTLRPIRIARHIADVVVHPGASAAAPPAELVVVDGMPEGCRRRGAAAGTAPHRADRENFDALGVSHRPLGRGIACIHVGEPVGGQVRLVADRGERLLVGLQGFHVLSVC